MSKKIFFIQIPLGFLCIQIQVLMLSKYKQCHPGQSDKPLWSRRSYRVYTSAPTQKHTTLYLYLYLYLYLCLFFLILHLRSYRDFTSAPTQEHTTLYLYLCLYLYLYLYSSLVFYSFISHSGCICVCVSI